MSFTPIPQRIEGLLQSAIEKAQAAGDLPTMKEHAQINAQVKPAKQSDYASPVAMASAKLFNKKPLDIAMAIAKHLSSDDLIAKAEVAPPGFINFWLNPDWIRAQVETIIAAGSNVFAQNVGQGQKVMVEFVSANPTGPLHVGRTRGAVIGDTVARLLEACGWNVHREYYFNNGGRQMELLGLSLKTRYLEALGIAADLPEDGYKGEYLIEMGKQLQQEVSDSWRDKDWKPFKDYAEALIFKSIEATLKRLGIVFDLFFNELDIYESAAVWKICDELVKRGHTYESAAWEGASEEEKAKAATLEAALWFRSTKFGDNQDRIIVRSNGDPTYVLPDIAYHVNKLDRGFDRVINILGSDHFTEAQVVKFGLEALGRDSSKVDVVLHQWVHIVKDGEVVSSSTRKGNFIPLDEIMDATSPDAIRYYMLSRSHENDVTFDLDLAVKQTNENPVYYIQNAHVRCAGILRQVSERGYPDDWDKDADLGQLGEEEMDFVLRLLEMPEMILNAQEALAPHQIAFWAHDLARAFHPMYERVRVLHTDVPEEQAKARLRMYRAAKVVFARLLGLMGMTTPEVM